MTVRKSPIAGSWYEGTEAALREQIRQSALSELGVGYDFAEIIDKGEDRRLVGIVSPHAGYMYSGPTATHAYAALHNHHPDLKELFVVGPDHRGYGFGLSAYPEGAWRTPLGDIEISTHLLSEVRDSELAFDIDSTAHSMEHSIDIQLPMIQYAYSHAPKFMPIMLTRQSLEQSMRLGRFLATVKGVVIAASSDLSHEYDYDRLERNDREMIDHLLTGDLESAERFRREADMTSCGFGAIYTLIHTASHIGRVEVEELAYSNSAMIMGKKPGQYTVGYLALAVYAV